MSKSGKWKYYFRVQEMTGAVEVKRRVLIDSQFQSSSVSAVCIPNRPKVTSCVNIGKVEEGIEGSPLNFFGA
jgi:hypothetical protein